MLRITVHQHNTRCRLELQGRLAGPWVAETETVWRSALRSGTAIDVDLRDVSSVDGAGRELLGAMHQAGARFIAKGVAMEALVAEIISKQFFDGTTRGSRM
jgi:ABC-type transporter Mla MlaB component